MREKAFFRNGRHQLALLAAVLLNTLVGFGDSLSQGELSLPDSSGEGGTKKIVAMRISSPVNIDGLLDEPVWQAGPKASSFFQRTPNYGAQPAESTEVIILYDSENLYVGIRCFDSQPDGIKANMTQRDSELWNDDAFEIFIDSFCDRQSCSYFVINPLGTQTDGRCTGNGATVESIWDGDWRARAMITSWGWCGELAIPFFNLPFDASEDQIWGINLMRVHKRTSQDYLWQLQKQFFRASDYGHLVGLSGLRKGRALEVIPFTTLRSGKNPDEELTGEVGGDLKYNLSPTLCANLTVNPDFAQIEADPDQINLSTEELRLPEKRPFFLEGCELFGTPTVLFYSRRIGEIMAGGKLTGKIDRVSLAVVDVQIPEERTVPTRFQDEEANFLAARLKTDVFGSSSIGLTGVNWANQKGYSRAAGLDAVITLPQECILGAQASFSADKDEILNFGEEKRWEKRIDFSHESRHLEGHLTYLDRDPEFNLNTGYFGGRANIRGLDGHITYMRPLESLHLHDANFNFFFSSFDDKDTGKLNYDFFRHNTSIFYKFLGYWFADGFDVQWSRERAGGQKYDNWQAYVSLIYNFANFENAGIRVKRGESFGATAEILESWLGIKPFELLSVELFTNRVTFTGHQNEIGWPDQWITNLKARLDVTRNIYLRGFFQTNDTHGWQMLRDVNLLLAWEFKRRSVLYAAVNYDEEWDDENARRMTSKKVLTKASLFFWI